MHMLTVECAAGSTTITRLCGNILNTDGGQLTQLPLIRSLWSFCQHFNLKLVHSCMYFCTCVHARRGWKTPFPWSSSGALFASFETLSPAGSALGPLVSSFPALRSKQLPLCLAFQTGSGSQTLMFTRLETNDTISLVLAALRQGKLLNLPV